jgi:hypothetical protein
MNGYSKRLIDENRAAKADHVGVRLGRLCIRRDTPVTEVAEYCKVSRMTVYNWFKGVTYPRLDIEPLVLKFIDKLASRST